MFKSLFFKLLIFFVIFSLLPVWWIGQSTMKDAMEANNASLIVIKSIGGKAMAVSDKALEELTVKFVQTIAYTVASQVGLHFALNPYLLKDTNPEDRFAWSKDKSFLKVMHQPIGKKGFTMIHGDNYRTWYHPNPKVVGFDQRNFKTKFPDFYNIIYHSIELKENFGDYYMFPDPDGVARKKYMFCALIKCPPPYEKTNLSTVAIHQLTEFNEPMKEVREEVITMTGAITKATKTAFQKRGTETNIILMMAVSFLLSISAVFVFTSEIGKPLKAIAEISSKIGEGNLRVKIAEDLKNQPGELGEMANSLDKIVNYLQKK